MELEKTLYRVHEKLMQTPNAKEILKPCIIVNFIIGGLLFFVMLIADISYRGNIGIIGKAITDY